MTLIEGFGDEVTLLLSITLFVVILYLVWLSTHVPDRPLLYLQLSSGSQPFSNAELQNLAGFDQGGGASEFDPNMEGSPNGSPSAQEQLNGEPLDRSEGEQDPTSREVPETSNESFQETSETGGEVGVTQPNTMANVGSFLSRVPQSLSNLRLRRRDRGDNSSRTNSATASLTPTNPNPSAANSSSQFSLTCLCLELPQCLHSERDSCYFIKLKFLSDLQTQVEVSSSETLSQFKNRVFKNVLSDGSQVRLIFAGGLLRNESVTLAECGILSNCVVHCQILSSTGPLSAVSSGSNNQTFSQSSPQDSFNSENMDLSNLLFLLFAVFLLVLWYLRFSYRHLFTPPTTFTLIAITLLFLLAVYASFIL